MSVNRAKASWRRWRQPCSDTYRSRFRAQCGTADLREIFYLWRPVLRDPKDDMVLELAVESQSDFIVTSNLRDFAAAESFGIEVVTAKQFLQKLGEIP
jgi:hypothetical protein